MTLGAVLSLQVPLRLVSHGHVQRLELRHLRVAEANCLRSATNIWGIVRLESPKRRRGPAIAKWMRNTVSPQYVDVGLVPAPLVGRGKLLFRAATRARTAVR